MALNFHNDNTILYLLKGNRAKIYRQMVLDSEKGNSGLATQKGLDELKIEAGNLADLIRQKAQEQAVKDQELSDRIESIDGIYFYIRYSPVANPTAEQMTTEPQEDTLYIGICQTTDEVAPLDPEMYDWILVVGEDALTLQIVSSHGNIFKNGNIATTLSVRLFLGSDDVTADFDDNDFLWTRVSDDAADDERWNQAHFGGVKSIQITGDDVFGKATFFCQLKDEVIL